MDNPSSRRNCGYHTQSDEERIVQGDRNFLFVSRQLHFPSATRFLKAPEEPFNLCHAWHLLRQFIRRPCRHPGCLSRLGLSAVLPGTGVYGTWIQVSEQGRLVLVQDFEASEDEQVYVFFDIQVAEFAQKHICRSDLCSVTVEDRHYLIYAVVSGD